ncbi:HPP family protein [Xanthobacter sp. AM11]|uniref:HPP family protein n=1 Tax=Xanthobacter sp. AM11 TaxID=3380643 RepID=UPI0039BED516
MLKSAPPPRSPSDSSAASAGASSGGGALRRRAVLAFAGWWPGWRRLALWAWQGLGGALAVGVMEIAAWLGETPLALIPFATSIVLVLGMPEAEAAQPRALVGGHVVSTLVGFAMLALFGSSEPAAAAAVGLAMVAMRATGTMHPPAAINPIIVVVEAMKPGFVLVPVGLGAVLLAAYAFGWHNLARRGSWPVRWW